MTPDGIKVTLPVTVIMEGMRLDSVLCGDMRDTLIFSDGGKASVTMIVESAEDWLRGHYSTIIEAEDLKQPLGFDLWSDWRSPGLRGKPITFEEIDAIQATTPWISNYKQSKTRDRGQH